MVARTCARSMPTYFKLCCWASTAADKPAGPMPMTATSNSAFGSGDALFSSCAIYLMTSAPSFTAFLINGVPETSPMMKQPGTFVMNFSFLVGTGLGLMILVVLTTMQACGVTGHAIWHEVSSMHSERATGTARLLTIASTLCGQASTHA